MATSNCNQNCGCNNTYTVTPPCPPACSEVFNSQCIVYTGTDILCDQDSVIKRYDYLDTVITKLVNYICSVKNSMPVTIIESDSEFLTVTSTTVGNTTTWVLDLVNLPSQQTYVVEAGGTNVTVDENTVGSTTTFTVTAQGTDVQSGDDYIDVTTTQVGDDDIVTITLDINEVAQDLGEVSVAQGTSNNVIVTTVNNFPTPNDTQYRLDVVSTDVQSGDARLTVVATGGIAPAYDQLFTLGLDDVALMESIMDQLVSTGPTDLGLVEGAGIQITYDPVLHQAVIASTFTDPERWFRLFDFAGTSLDPSVANASLTITADSVTDGISAILSGTGSAAVFTLANTDKGSDQNIFKTINIPDDASTIVAASNSDSFTIAGGSDIDVTSTGNTITIDCTIDNIYSNIVGDDAVSLQAPTTTSTLEILGGVGISTAGVVGPNNTLTITNDAPNVDQNLWETIASDSGSTTADSTTDTLTVAGGTGISTAIVGDTLTITNDAPNVDQLLWLTFEGDTGGAIAATTTTDALTVAGANGITTNTTGTTLTITSPVNISESAVTYTLSDPAQTYNHGLGNQWVVARAFLGTADVTSTTVFTMTSTTQLTFANGSSNIDRIVVIG